jgi:CO/xanthine dehydrogenase FAD-binding subunit
MTAVSPRSLDAALAALASDSGLVPVAGCTDLMVGTPAGCETTLKGRTGRRATGVLDLQRIPELRGIAVDRDGLDIGAAVSFTELRRSPDVARMAPILAQAAAVVGGWQIQNRATIGGNVANASPAGDSLPVLLALDARLVIAGPKGPRELAYDRFHVGYRQTALLPDELIIRIRIPRLPPGAVQRFRKVGTREAQAISKVVVAMSARVDRGILVELRLAAGSVAPTPVRLREAEKAGVGRAAGADTALRVARAAAAEVHPIDDVRSTAAYRSFALERVVRRLLSATDDEDRRTLR